MNSRILSLLLFFVLSATGPAWSFIHNVPADYGTIQEGIIAADPGDTVLVAPGTYIGDGNRDIDFLGKAIVVGGWFLLEGDTSFVSTTIVDCGGSEVDPHRGFYFGGDEGPESRLEGLTITNGYKKEGAGICCYDSSPVIAHCYIVGNFNNANIDGGGILCSGGAPVISGCRITGNRGGADGGGIYCRSGSSPTISDCQISENHASYGGGIYNSESCSPFLANCTISNNTATTSGGGIYCYYYTNPIITNCTITGNSITYGSGGGMCCSLADPVVANSIFWGNSPEEIYAFAGNVIITYSDIDGGWPGTGNIDMDPLFVDPTGEDYHLAAMSPCIDAGVDAGVYIDFEGDSRPQGAYFDMGVDEFVYEGPGLRAYPDFFAYLIRRGEIMTDDTLFVISTGTEDLTYVVNTCEELWLTLSGETEGTLAPGDTGTVVLEFDYTGMGDGTYPDTLFISCNDPSKPVVPVPVQLDLRGWIISVPEDFGAIQAAIDEALSGDTILVAAGTYVERINFNGKAITVRSDAGAPGTVIDGNLGGSVARFTSGEGPGSVLDGFTLTNGRAYGGSYKFGGGIYCIDASPLIINNIITGNVAEGGSGNYGAGICCDAASSAYILGNRITDNNASGAKSYGGGIYCYCSSPSIIRNKISGNSAGTWGGGIFSKGSPSPKIAGNLISGNDAGNGGGGIGLYDGSFPLITSNTISGNTAASSGGGIFFRNATAVITNNTIVANTAGYFGGGISEGSPVVANTVLWENYALNGPQIYGGSPSVTYSDVQGGWTGEGNIDADPLFSGGSDYHISAGSPCIDAGCEGAVFVDIDGDPRPIGVGFDIGSDEYAGGTPDGLIVFLEDCPLYVEPGGALTFTAGVLNAGATTSSFDHAEMIITGPLSLDLPLYAGMPVTVPPGGSVSTTVFRNIPAIGAPAGLYLVAIVIRLDGTALSSDHFEVMVLY